ncbi:MAG: SEC-C metal-binding domain-containing protein, partial [Solirubrobacteraceae bacterium]
GAEGAEGEAMPVVEQRVLADDELVGRNDPCPCGSGKKYKRCPRAEAAGGRAPPWGVGSRRWG